MKIQPAPSPVLRFEEMPLAKGLFSALDKMRIHEPTPVQCQTIPACLAGSDLIAVAETGSGKTLAYALPLLTRLAEQAELRALVLAPSREVAQQIHKVFEALCAELPVSSVLVIGGLPGAKQSSHLKKNPKLIIATPGRMNDHLLTNKLLLKGVGLVVVDEADRMLDMGFVPQLKNIQATMRGSRQTLMFSASFGPAVSSVAEVFMAGDVVMIRSTHAEAPVEGLRQTVILIDQAQKHARLLDELNETEGGVIIFTSDKESCERLGHSLKSCGYSADFIHGELSHGHRSRVIREFRSGQIRIVVATDLLARGLDVPHVEHVINFELPKEAEDFLHRIGRTARAGREGTAITFVTPQDERKYRLIRPYLRDAEELKVNPNFKFAERGRGPRRPPAGSSRQNRR